MLVSSDNEMSLAKIIDVEALIMTAGAKERTEEEYKDIFDRAGFKLNRVIPTRSQDYNYSARYFCTSFGVINLAQKTIAMTKDIFVLIERKVKN
jgi:hypothetical protein